MQITELSISGIRCIHSAFLQPHPRFNQLVGPNGAGKTSFLEAIYLLSAGHSFRTRRTKDLLNTVRDPIQIIAKLSDLTTNTTHQAGYGRDYLGQVAVKLDYERLQSIAPMSRLLPVKALSPNSHQLIQDGPELRRQFLDWGVFHVEPDFFNIWKSYRRILTQRNQAIKTRRSISEISAWDKDLSISGEKIDSLRRDYLEELKPHFQQYLRSYQLKPEVLLAYRSGWKQESSLLQALKQEHQNEPRQPFTTIGPHRADMAINAFGQSAKNVLSRGEQKLVVYALHFSQLELFSKHSSSKPIMLCDDLSAELDNSHRMRILESLNQLGIQTFLTGNSALTIPSGSEQMVSHLADGKIVKVL